MTRTSTVDVQTFECSCRDFYLFIYLYLQISYIVLWRFYTLAEDWQIIYLHSWFGISSKSNHGDSHCLGIMRDGESLLQFTCFIYNLPVNNESPPLLQVRLHMRWLSGEELVRRHWFSRRPRGEPSAPAGLPSIYLHWMNQTIQNKVKSLW